MHCVAAAGLWRFLRDGALTDKTYTMAELHDRIDNGYRDPVWGGLVCRDSDSLWLPLREVSFLWNRCGLMASTHAVVPLVSLLIGCQGVAAIYQPFMDTEGC